MEPKFIIFVVFSILSQCSFVLSSGVNYGLTEEELVGLSEIKANQQAALVAKYDATNPVFDMLEKLSAQLAYNLKADTEDVSNIIAAALVSAKNGIDLSLNSIPIALGKSCPTIETVRGAQYERVEHVYSLIPNATALVQSGNYSEKRAQIDALQTAALADAADYAKQSFDFLRDCSPDTTDPATVAAIKSAEAGASKALSQVTNAAFNGIKIYGAALSNEYRDGNFLLVIRELRNKGLHGFRREVEYEFGLLKALYINTQLNQTGILSHLVSNQYAQTVSSYRFNDAGEGVSRAIISGWKRVQIGFWDDGREDFSWADADKAEVAVKIQAGALALMKSFQPDTNVGSSIVENAVKKLSGVTDKIVANYFDAIALAEAQDIAYSVVVPKIEEQRVVAVNQAGIFIQNIFDVLAFGQTLNIGTVAVIQGFKNEATAATSSIIGAVFDLIQIHATFSHGIQLSEDNAGKVLNIQNRLTSGISKLSSSVSFAHATTFEH